MMPRVDLLLRCDNRVRHGDRARAGPRRPARGATPGPVSLIPRDERHLDRDIRHWWVRTPGRTLAESGARAPRHDGPRGRWESRPEGSAPGRTAASPEGSPMSATVVPARPSAG